MSLFSEFKELSHEKWKEKIISELKLNAFDEVVRKNRYGNERLPFYTQSNRPQNGFEFLVRNPDICETIFVHDEKFANEQALRALKEGASGLIFNIDKKIRVKELLKKIELDHIYTCFKISNDAADLKQELELNYGKINEYDGKWKCFIDLDPLRLLARFGEWHSDEKKDLSALTSLKHIPLDISTYREGGADLVTSYAIGLCHMNEYLNYFSSCGTPIPNKIHCTVSIGGDFFNEIASLRALRRLLHFLAHQYRITPDIHIHAFTTATNKSSHDTHTNMLRTTTEAMSALIGGANSVSVAPFDQLTSVENEFSSRIARNQLHILKDESYLSKVSDSAGGSYYIESLTEQTASNAWEEFKKLEMEGGFIECMKKGYIQNIISEQVKMKKQEIESEKSVLVGVNKYQLKKTPTIVNFIKQEMIIGKVCAPIHPVLFAAEFENKTPHPTH